MTTARISNHSAVIVPHKDRENLRKFYCDVLGGSITKSEADRDFVRLENNFYIVFLYGDVPDESEFLRSARSIWLEIESDNVEDMTRRILASNCPPRRLASLIGQQECKSRTTVAWMCMFFRTRYRDPAYNSTMRNPEVRWQRI